MNRIKNLAGQRFGRLLVTEFKGRRHRHALWLCKCDCGKLVKVEGYLLCRGSVCSCGCLRRELLDKVIQASKKVVGCSGCGKKMTLLKCSKQKYCSIKCYRKPQKSRCGHLPVASKGLCKRCYGKLYRTINPEPRTARARRNYYLSAKYGISAIEYEALVKQNSGGCWICGRQPTPREKSLNVDHDHAIKEKSINSVRGVLCWRCNNGLSFFKDNPELFRRAAVYLERKLFDIGAKDTGC